MNPTMEDARKGAKDVVRLLESKQLRANTAKSRFVVIGSQKSRTEILKEAADNPIMMGDMIIENSKSEKYLSDQILEDGSEAIITATLDGRIPSAIDKAEIIINSINHPTLMGHRVAYAAVEQFKMKISSKILTNCESWIGLTQKQIDRIQNVQDNFFKKVFQAASSGTPVCMIRLNCQTLQVKWQIILKKIKQVQ